MADTETAEESSSGILQEMFTSPLNLSLLGLCIFILLRIFCGDKPADMGEVEEPLPKLKNRDFTLAELQPYDGLQNRRILMAVNSKVFDVTTGKKLYGPGKISCRLFTFVIYAQRNGWRNCSQVACWSVDFIPKFVNYMYVCITKLLHCNCDHSKTPLPLSLIHE